MSVLLVRQSFLELVVFGRERGLTIAYKMLYVLLHHINSLKLDNYSCCVCARKEVLLRWFHVAHNVAESNTAISQICLLRAGKSQGASSVWHWATILVATSTIPPQPSTLPSVGLPVISGSFRMLDRYV